MTCELNRADITTPAVILRFDHNVMHHGGLGAIRSLGRLPIPVYGVHEERWASEAHSRYLTGRFFWRPDAGQAEGARGAGLMRLSELIDRPAVLLPTDDAGAVFLTEHGASLRQSFLFPAPPSDLPRRVAGKYSMFHVHGLNSNTSMADRAAFDNACIEHWSLWMDLVILVRTVCLAVMAAAGQPQVAGVSQPATATAPEAPFHTGSYGGQQ